MLSRILYMLCSYTTVAFVAAFVGAAVGIAASRACRAERGSSWLMVLGELIATGAFLLLLFMPYFGAFDRPVMAGGLRLVMVLAALGLGVATPSVVRADQGSVALIAAALGTILTLILATVLMVLMPSLRMVATFYFLGVFAPPVMGLFFGWWLAWQRDFDDILDAEMASRVPPVAP